MAIRWLLDSHITTARKAIQLGLTRDTCSDIGRIFDVFEQIVGAKISLRRWKDTRDKPAASQYECINGQHVIRVTESLLSDPLRAYLILSECMACCAYCEAPPDDGYFGIIEQVFFNERDPKFVSAEAPQVQLEQLTDLAALEIIFPTEERHRFRDDFCSGDLDTVSLAKQLGVPTAILECCMAEAYLKYCQDLAAE